MRRPVRLPQRGQPWAWALRLAIPVAAALTIHAGAAGPRPGAPTDRIGTSQDVDSGGVVRIGVLRGGSYEVVVVPIETYVARVLVGEALPESPPAALEALAVAIRTYTLVNMGRHNADGFDLCDQTHCQVMRTSTPAAERASLATAGRVLVYKGTPANIYYSASCGGRTEKPSNVWPGADDPPYLPSRHDDGCGGAPGWSAELSVRDLQRAFTAGGYSGSLRNMRIAARNESGRVARLMLDGLSPSEISGQDLRTVVGRTLGWRRIQSASFDLHRVGASFRFTGRGSGHGVGMCVIGSSRLAAAGVSASEILRRYYPGTQFAPMLLARAGATLSPAPATSTAATPEPPLALPPTFTPPPALSVSGVPSSGGAASLAVAPSAPAPASPLTSTSRTASSPAAASLSGGATSVRTGVSVLLDGDESERRMVGALVLRERDALARALGVPAPASVVVRIHPTPSAFERATGQPWFALGATQDSELHLLPLSLLQDHGVLERTLRHQLVHALADRPLAGRPAWVREGAAVHFSEGKAGLLLKGPCPPDADLMRPISVGALGDALARARACFERELDSGRPWRDVR